MNRIGIVCGEFHRQKVEYMLEVAMDAAAGFDLDVAEVIWVPGSMEAPLALTRLLQREDIAGAATLGIIEKGETQHGQAIGFAVIQTIIDLQLVFNKPIGLGIIGPGAEPQHIESRLEPHAKNAINAINAML